MLICGIYVLCISVVSNYLEDEREKEKIVVVGTAERENGKITIALDQKWGATF